MKKGFTLIELLVVISVIGMLASVVLASLSGAREGGRIGAANIFSDNLNQNFGASAILSFNLDEGSGATSADLAGNKIDLSVNTGSWVPGIRGSALSFTSAVNSWSTTARTITLGTSWTMATWIKPTTLPPPTASRIYLSMGRPYFAVNTEGRLTVAWCTSSTPCDSSTTVSITGNSTIKAGNWYFVAATRSGGTTVLYLDGKEIGRDSTSAFHSPSVGLYLGNHAWGGGTMAGCDCALDEVRVYSEALTVAQIEKLYTEGAAKHGIALK